MEVSIGQRAARLYANVQGNLSPLKGAHLAPNRWSTACGRGYILSPLRGSLGCVKYVDASQRERLFCSAVPAVILALRVGKNQGISFDSPQIHHISSNEIGIVVRRVVAKQPVTLDPIRPAAGHEQFVSNDEFFLGQLSKRLVTFRTSRRKDSRREETVVAEYQEGRQGGRIG